MKQLVEEGGPICGTADVGRGIICRTEFAISQFINLVLSFKIEESVFQLLFNFSEW